MTYSLRERFVAALSAFKEPAVIAKLLDDSGFVDFDNRRLRYAIYWAFYENTAYRPVVHKWSQGYRQRFGLYKHTRGIYNPAYRLGEFWKTHLFGGLLDADGQNVPTSAIPIKTDNENLREAILQLWLWSGWGQKKDQLTLWGSVLGDVFVEIVDDPEKKKVYAEITHPSLVKEVELDPYGNVKGYTKEYDRPDPERGYKDKAKYTELAIRVEEWVVYETLRNDQPYAWDGEEAYWAEPYGFIPMVFIKHNDVGLDWGWSEFHPVRGKVHEVDDLASKASDHVRKYVDPIWMFSGVKRKEASVTKQETTPTTDRPEPGREELPAIYAPLGAEAKALVADLDLAAALEHINNILEEVERDYPELQMDIWGKSGSDSGQSGKALRTARQRTESKGQTRRGTYDNAMVRIHQMGVAIGGFREYDGFDGFNLESFEEGDLDHSIGERPFFAADPLDELEIEKAFWAAANEAESAGMPLELWLKRQGWDDKEIAEIAASPQRQAKMQALSNLALLGVDRDDEEDEEDEDE